MTERNPLAAFREWVNRLWGTLRRQRADRDLEEELRVHLEFAAEDMRRRSSSPENLGAVTKLQTCPPQILRIVLKTKEVSAKSERVAPKPI